MKSFDAVRPYGLHASIVIVDCRVEPGNDIRGCGAVEDNYRQGLAAGMAERTKWT
jgi:hypothetical protein